MERAIPFIRLAGIREYSSTFSQMGNDYIFSRINKATKNYVKVNEPIRVSGMAFCLLLKGDLSLEINDEEFDLKPASLFLFHSNSVLKVTNAEWSEIDAYMLFISVDFLQNININLNAVNFSVMEGSPSPVLDNLSENELYQLKGYMDLLDSNAHYNIESPYSRNVALSLIQALLYQLMQIKYDRSARQSHAESDAVLNRKLNYVQEFIKLVQTHHYKERSLQFYADKLFISPKYLSRLIKESTGRSAADWIDQFVLLEAKNMLRFSNKNIQQVAYALNFTTQSSFGKFFKHLTGMSPSDYQKT